MRCALEKTAPEWEVPDFEVVPLAGKRHQYCTVVPVINEGERLIRQLETMQRVDHGTDLIIADGGSHDGSSDPERLRNLGVRTLLVKTGAGRLSAQLRMAFAFALREGYDGIVTVDGNGKDGIDAVPLFVQALRHGYDFVQGSRYIAGGLAENTPPDRAFAVKFIHAPLLSLAAGFRYTDTTNGFRGFSPRLLRDPRVQPFRAVFDAYNLHYYLAIRAARLGFTIKEVPVRRSYPTAGATPTKIRGIGPKLAIVKQLLLAMSGAYNP